jgi:hypothetical protein
MTLNARLTRQDGAAMLYEEAKLARANVMALSVPTHRGAANADRAHVAVQQKVRARLIYGGRVPVLALLGATNAVLPQILTLLTDALPSWLARRHAWIAIL